MVVLTGTHLCNYMPDDAYYLFIYKIFFPINIIKRDRYIYSETTTYMRSAKVRIYMLMIALYNMLMEKMKRGLKYVFRSMDSHARALK